MWRNGEEKWKEEQHQKLVSCMIPAAEGGAGLLHEITKPTAWRGVVPVLQEDARDVRLWDRCEEKRKEWAKHWQCNTELQDLKDKTWRNEHLRSLEDGLQKTKNILEKATRSYKAASVWDVMDFTGKVRQKK